MRSEKTNSRFSRPVPDRGQPAGRKPEKQYRSPVQDKQQVSGRSDRPQGAGKPYGEGKPQSGGRTYGAGKHYDADKSYGAGRPQGAGKSYGAGKPRRNEKPGGTDQFSRTEGLEKSYKYEQNERFDLQEQNSDILEGRNPVLEALKSGRAINKLLVGKGEREGSIKQVIAIAKEKGIVVQEVDRQKLDSLSQTGAHQGVVAFVAAKEYVEVEDILATAAEKNEPPFIIILDEIMDANNLGSVLRTADAVGAHGIIIPKRRAVGLTAAVAKASAGAVEYVPVARVTNLAQTIDQLKKQNIWVVGTEADAKESFHDSDLKGPIALVIGSEGEGMSRLIRDKCDFTVNIPMMGKISSLNAAVAGAIVMYEIFRQRSR